MNRPSNGTRGPSTAGGRVLGAFVLMGIFVYAFARYSDSLPEFFFLDDFWMLNAAARGGDSAIEAFGRLGPARLYRPLTQDVYYFVLGRVFGIDSTGYHLVHLSAFAATCVLATLIGSQLTGSWIRALVVGVLYTSAPGHAAAVYWIAAFTMIGSAFVTLAAIAWWLWAAGRPRIVGGAVLQIIGLCCSEHTVVLPLLLFLIAVLGPRGQNPVKAFKELIPLGSLVGAYCVVRVVAAVYVELPLAYTPRFQAAIWLTSLGRYLIATLNLATLSGPSLGAQTAVGVGVLVAFALAIILVWRGASWARLTCLGIGLFLAALLPVLPLTRHYYDYYVGVAALGSGIALVGLGDLFTRYTTLASLVIATLVVTGDMVTCDRAARANRTVYEVRLGQAASAQLLKSLRATEELVDSRREIAVPRTPSTDHVIDVGQALALFLDHPQRVTVVGGRTHAVNAVGPPRPTISGRGDTPPFWWNPSLGWVRALADRLHSAYAGLHFRCKGFL